MSYYAAPDKKEAKILFLYRNFKAYGGGSHVGLGVGATHAVKTLRNMGIKASVEGIWTKQHVIQLLEGKYKDATHIIIEAIWLSAGDMAHLCYAFPHMHFVVRCHSQIGFLQVEAGAVQILRQLLNLQDTVMNMSVAGNNERFCRLIETMYRSHCLYIPNLYDIPISKIKRKSAHRKDTLKVSSWGAVRLMKNHCTAAAAALALARQTGKNLEFYMSVNRNEGGGSGSVLQAIRNLFVDLPWAKFIEVPWADWAQFRHTVGEMDVGFQLSSSETFNITVADCLSQGVPCVVGESIEWVPECWQVNIDDALQAAAVGAQILENGSSGKKGQKALQSYMDGAKKVWLKWLKVSPTKKQRWLWF